MSWEGTGARSNPYDSREQHWSRQPPPPAPVVRDPPRDGWKLPSELEFDFSNTGDIGAWKPYLMSLNILPQCIEYWSNLIVRHITEEHNRCEIKTIEIFSTFVDVFDEVSRKEIIQPKGTVPNPNYATEYICAVRIALCYIFNHVLYTLGHQAVGVTAASKRDAAGKRIRHPSVVAFESWKLYGFEFFLTPICSILRDMFKKRYGIEQNLMQIAVGLPSASQTMMNYQQTMMAQGRSLHAGSTIPPPPDQVAHLPLLWESHLNIPEGARPQLEASKALLLAYKKVIDICREKYFAGKEDQHRLRALFEYKPASAYPTDYDEFMKHGGRDWGEVSGGEYRTQRTDDADQGGMKFQTTLNNTLARLLPMCKALCGHASEESWNLAMESGHLRPSDLATVKAFGLSSSVPFEKTRLKLKRAGIDLLAPMPSEAPSIEDRGELENIVNESVMGVAEELAYTNACWTMMHFVQELNTLARPVALKEPHEGQDS